MDLSLVYPLLQRCWSSNRTPNAGSRQPHKLPLVVSQSRKDRFRSMLSDNTIISPKMINLKMKIFSLVIIKFLLLPKCFLYSSIVSNIFSLSSYAIQIQFFSFHLEYYIDGWVFLKNYYKIGPVLRRIIILY